MSVLILGSWIVGLSQTPFTTSLNDAHPSPKRLLPESAEDLNGVQLSEIPALARSRATALLKQQSASSSSARWTFIGPAPVANGRGLGAEGFCGEQSKIDVSGRVTTIAFGAA